MLQIGMTLASRYRIEEQIGEGGMAIIYRAIDLRTNANVAVKALKEQFNNDHEFLERFQREADTASILNNPNLVKLLDVGQEGDSHYIVLEYVEGQNLKQYILQCKKLDYDLAGQITLRILSGLDHAHSNNVIHRDIKPQNILIDKNGFVKVSDFGIARIADSFTVQGNNTVLCSVHYAAPEQMNVNGVADFTSDLYSTGVVLYEMLTGHVPFVAENPMLVMLQHTQCRVPPIEKDAPNVPPAMIAVVMKALEKKQENRFQSAKEMAEALTKAMNGTLQANDLRLTPPAELESVQTLLNQKEQSDEATRQKAEARKRRHKIRLTVSIAAVVVVMVLLGFAVLRVYSRIANTVIAPYLIGLQDQQAKTTVEREGLVFQSNYVYHDTVPSGVVISQIPSADTELEKGDSILTTISKGPASVLTPNVVGMLYDEASKTLTNAGFSSVIVVKTVSLEEPGIVIAQSPMADATYSAGDSAEITVSGGSTVVPDLIGRGKTAAIQMINDNHLTVSSIQYVETQDEALVDTVLEQSPDAGSLLILNAGITLTVASAPKPYHSEISVSLPAIDAETPLRVTLIENGKESVAYETTLPIGIATVMLIPLNASTEGEMECVVYLNGEELQRQTITMR